nr:InlB B-repeat-containing protein [Clostridia bacterium]
YTVTGDTVFEAQVSTKQIDVTFYDANGDVYEIKTVEYGTSTEGLEPNAGNPTRDGGDFDSWDWSGVTVITDEATATPIFIDEEYSIAFNSNSEDDVVTSFTFGEVFTQAEFEDIFADYIPEGYEVTEWQVGGVAVTFPYTVTDLGQNNAVVAVTTITNPITYHIYYYVDGTLDSTLTQNLIIGDQITPQPLPNSPQSSGYNPGIAYDDWFSDASCQTVYTFPANMGSSNITVYTQASLCAFDNAFHYLDGRIVYVTSTYTRAIETPNTDDPNAADYYPWTVGYTGNRWTIPYNSQPAQCLDIYETSDGQSTTSYAISVYYYDLDEGAYVMDEQASTTIEVPYTPDTTVSVPTEMLTRTGYVLNETDSTLETELQLDTMAELEVYFDLGQYTLTIDDNNQLITDTLFYTEDIDLGTPAGKIGHSLDETNPYTWTDGEGNIIEPQDTMPAYDVTVTVNYVPNEYPLTVYINGVVDDTLSTTILYGETIEEVDYTPEAGYDFSGWKTDSSLQTEYTFGEPMTEDGAEIYGEVTPHVYTIVYMVDGAEVNREDYAFGADVTPYEPTLAEGYDFHGWTPAEPTKMTIPEDGSDELVLNADVRPHVYSVVYYNEDGSVIKTAQTAFGAAPVPPTTNPSKTGNDFSGWEYTPALEEGGVIGAGDYTATPIFTPIDYTYTFYKTSGDTEAYATGTAAYGSEITAPADPDRGENYTFLGWKKVNASDNTPLETLTMDEVGGVSYVAIWEVNSDACFVKGVSRIAPEFYYTKGVAKYQVLVEQPARKLWIIDGNDGSRRPYDKASWLNNDGGVEYTGNDVPNSGIYNIVANADGSETWTIDGFYGAGTHQIYAVLPNGETDQANPYEFTVVYNEKTPAQVADDITSVTLKTTDNKDVPATGIVRGTDLVWTVTTSTDVTWLRFEGSYTADGEPKTVKTLYKYTATSDRVSVTDADGVRTWVITMKFAYSASDLQITETWKLSYRLGTKSTYYQYKKAGDTTATEFQVIVGLNEEALEPVPVGYEKYQLVEVTPTASTLDLGRHEIKVKTTADCTKVRITVGTKKVCYQYSETNPSANVTFSTENNLLVWTINHNFNVAGENMTVKVETRGDAWTAQPYTYTVTVA